MPKERVTIGDLYKRLGDFEKALFYYEQYEKQFPQKLTSYTKKADLLSAIGDHQKAIENYSKALSIDPINIQIQDKLIDCELRITGDIKHTMNQYQDLLNKCSNPKENTAVQLSIQNCYRLMGKINDCYKTYDIVWSESAKFLSPSQIIREKIMVLEYYVDIAQTSKAIKILDELKKEMKPPLDDLIYRGYLLVYTAKRDIGNILESLKKFDNYIEATDDHRWDYSIVLAEALVHELNSEYEEAIIKYNHCAKIGPLAISNYNFNIGRCYRKMKEYKKSEEHLKQGLSIFNRSPKRLMGL